MEKRNLWTRIRLPIALAASLAGCAGMPQAELPGKPFRYGYRIESESAVLDVRTAAGIAAGTIKVQGTPERYMASGSFSEVLYPEVMEKALDIADQDNDMYVTNEEARSLSHAAAKVALNNQK